MNSSAHSVLTTEQISQLTRKAVGRVETRIVSATAFHSNQFPQNQQQQQQLPQYAGRQRGGNNGGGNFQQHQNDDDFGEPDYFPGLNQQGGGHQNSFCGGNKMSQQNQQQQPPDDDRDYFPDSERFPSSSSTHHHQQQQQTALGENGLRQMLDDERASFENRIWEAFRDITPCARKLCLCHEADSLLASLQQFRQQRRLHEYTVMAVQTRINEWRNTLSGVLSRVDKLRQDQRPVMSDSSHHQKQQQSHPPRLPHQQRNPHSSSSAALLPTAAPRQQQQQQQSTPPKQQNLFLGGVNHRLLQYLLKTKQPGSEALEAEVSRSIREVMDNNHNSSSLPSSILASYSSRGVISHLERIRQNFQLEQREQQPSAAAAASAAPPLDLPSGKRCFGCGQIGHFVGDCTNQGACYICHQQGHTQQQCPSLQHKQPHRKSVIGEFYSQLIAYFIQHRSSLTPQEQQLWADLKKTVDAADEMISADMKSDLWQRLTLGQKIEQKLLRERESGFTALCGRLMDEGFLEEKQQQKKLTREVEKLAQQFGDQLEQQQKQRFASSLASSSSSAAAKSMTSLTQDALAGHDSVACVAPASASASAPAPAPPPLSSSSSSSTSILSSSSSSSSSIASDSDSDSASSASSSSSSSSAPRAIVPQFDKPVTKANVTTALARAQRFLTAAGAPRPGGADARHLPIVSGVPVMTPEAAVKMFAAPVQQQQRSKALLFSRSETDVRFDSSNRKYVTIKEVTTTSGDKCSFHDRRSDLRRRIYTEVWKQRDKTEEEIADEKVQKGLLKKDRAAKPALVGPEQFSKMLAELLGRDVEPLYSSVEFVQETQRMMKDKEKYLNKVRAARRDPVTGAQFRAREAVNMNTYVLANKRSNGGHYIKAGIDAVARSGRSLEELIVIQNRENREDQAAFIDKNEFYSEVRVYVNRVLRVSSSRVVAGQWKKMIENGEAVAETKEEKKSRSLLASVMATAAARLMQQHVPVKQIERNNARRTLMREVGGREVVDLDLVQRRIEELFDTANLLVMRTEHMRLMSANKVHAGAHTHVQVLCAQRGKTQQQKLVELRHWLCNVMWKEKANEQRKSMIEKGSSVKLFGSFVFDLPLPFDPFLFANRFAKELADLIVPKRKHTRKTKEGKKGKKQVELRWEDPRGARGVGVGVEIRRRRLTRTYIFLQKVIINIVCSAYGVALPSKYKMDSPPTSISDAQQMLYNAIRESRESDVPIWITTREYAEADKERNDFRLRRLVPGSETQILYICSPLWKNLARQVRGRMLLYGEWPANAFRADFDFGPEPAGWQKHMVAEPESDDDSSSSSSDSASSSSSSNSGDNNGGGADQHRRLPAARAQPKKKKTFAEPQQSQKAGRGPGRRGRGAHFE